MTRRRLLLLAILLLAASMLAAAWWLTRPSDEKLIMELVARAEQAVEGKDVKEIMACVARDYRDPSGLTHADIMKLAMHWGRSPNRVEVAITDYQLEAVRPVATGRFEVELDFRNNLPPERLHLRVEFERQRRGWFRKEWVVKSVAGHGLMGDLVGYV